MTVGEVLRLADGAFSKIFLYLPVSFLIHHGI